MPSAPLVTLPTTPIWRTTWTCDARTERAVLAGVGAAALPLIEPRAAELLVGGEAEYYGGLKFPKRRNEFLLGRWAAKSAVAAWIERPQLDAIEIVPGVFQQPVVHASQREPVAVTLAHSRSITLALATGAGHPVGIDVEDFEPQQTEVIRTQVGRREIPAAAGELENEAHRLLLIWAAKEALSKALRSGLTCPFEILAVDSPTIDSTGLCTGRFVNFAQYQFAAWMSGGSAIALVLSKKADLRLTLPGLRDFCIQLRRHPE